ncbi:MAG: hypothetical protein QW815_05195 [Nitrososphaerota archaeon]
MTIELMDHFLDVEKKREVIAVGLGTAGCRILARIKREDTFIDRFLAISVDEEDLRYLKESEKLLIPFQQGGKISPRYVRTAVSNYAHKINTAIGRPFVTFTIAGLGGGVGSALAPIVAKAAKDVGSFSIAIAVMPFDFEKGKHFYAGLSLRRLLSSADAVIVVDNESFLKDFSHMPMMDLLTTVNEKICLALKAITSYPDPRSFSVGLKKLTQTIQENGISILSIGSSTSHEGEALAGAVLPVYRITDPHKASRAIFHWVGSQLRAEDVATSVKRLADLMGNDYLEVHYGFTVSANSTPVAIMIVSGFSTTKFDEYDPLWSMFDKKGNQLDELPEQSISLELNGLASIE